MVNITEKCYESIKAHSAESYPDEACGLLVGVGETIERVSGATNINKERSGDRYEIDPAEFLAIEKSASADGLDVIGFYHSHPDHPDRPSEFDRMRAWEEYAYIILSVCEGKVVSARSWRLSLEDDEFCEDEINILR